MGGACSRTPPARVAASPAPAPIWHADVKPSSRARRGTIPGPRASVVGGDGGTRLSTVGGSRLSVSAAYSQRYSLSSSAASFVSLGPDDLSAFPGAIKDGHGGYARSEMSRRVSSESFRRSSRTSDKRQSRRTTRNSYATRLSKWELEDLDDENAVAIEEAEPADGEATATAPTPTLIEQEALTAKEDAPVAQSALEKMKRAAEMGEDIEGDEHLPFSQAVVRIRNRTSTDLRIRIPRSPSAERSVLPADPTAWPLTVSLALPRTVRHLLLPRHRGWPWQGQPGLRLCSLSSARRSRNRPLHRPRRPRRARRRRLQRAARAALRPAQLVRLEHQC